MNLECVVVARNCGRAVVAPVDQASEQLAYAKRMRAEAERHRGLAAKYDALADGASERVTVIVGPRR